MSVEKSINGISEEKLDDVSGGIDWLEERTEFLPAGHGRHIGKYEAEGHIGKKVYAVNDQFPSQVCVGKLVDSYEKDDGCGTERYHKISVFSGSRMWAEFYRGAVLKKIRLIGIAELPGDYFTLFLAE